MSVLTRNPFSDEGMVSRAQQMMDGVLLPAHHTTGFKVVHHCSKGDDEKARCTDALNNAENAHVLDDFIVDCGLWLVFLLLV
jgi:uncharacterized protein YgiB involved in biofilm formation